LSFTTLPASLSFEGLGVAGPVVVLVVVPGLAEAVGDRVEAVRETVPQPLVVVLVLVTVVGVVGVGCSRPLVVGVALAAEPFPGRDEALPDLRLEALRFVPSTVLGPRRPRRRRCRLRGLRAVIVGPVVGGVGPLGPTAILAVVLRDAVRRLGQPSSDLGAQLLHAARRPPSSSVSSSPSPSPSSVPGALAVTIVGVVLLRLGLVEPFLELGLRPGHRQAELTQLVAQLVPRRPLDRFTDSSLLAPVLVLAGPLTPIVAVALGVLLRLGLVEPFLELVLAPGHRQAELTQLVAQLVPRRPLDRLTDSSLLAPVLVLAGPLVRVVLRAVLAVLGLVLVVGVRRGSAVGANLLCRTFELVRQLRAQATGLARAVVVAVVVAVVAVVRAVTVRAALAVLGRRLVGLRIVAGCRRRSSPATRRSRPSRPRAARGAPGPPALRGRCRARRRPPPCRRV
jgi:hypothetical protein